MLDKIKADRPDGCEVLIRVAGAGGGGALRILYFGDIKL